MKRQVAPPTKTKPIDIPPTSSLRKETAKGKPKRVRFLEQVMEYWNGQSRSKSADVGNERDESRAEVDKDQDESGQSERI